MSCDVLVMGLCTTNVRAISEPFFTSILKNSPGVHLCVNSEANGRYDPREQLSLERIRGYLKVLTSGVQAHKVILTDIRDVVIQKNLLEFPCGDLDMYLECEDVSIEENLYNTHWVSQFYGVEMLEAIGHKPIVNVSVMAGRQDKIVEYLNALLQEMQSRLTPANGLDMAAHNVLLHYHNYPCNIIGNDGPVFTCGLFDNITIDKHVILNPKGQVPYLVHQYDRHVTVP